MSNQDIDLRSVGDTKKYAYDQAKKTSSTQKKVMLEEIKKHGPGSDEDLADRLGWEKNVVNARRNELVTDKELAKVSTKINPRTGKPNKVWGIPEKPSTRPTDFLGPFDNHMTTSPPPPASAAKQGYLW